MGLQHIACLAPNQLTFVEAHFRKNTVTPTSLIQRFEAFAFCIPLCLQEYFWQGLDLVRFYSPCRKLTCRLEKRIRRERFTSAGIKVTINLVRLMDFHKGKSIVYNLIEFNNPFAETSRASLLFLVRI